MKPAAHRPIRLLLTTFKTRGAGSMQSVQYLAEGLLARGHDVRVACAPEGVLGRRLRERGVPTVPLRFHRGWSVGAARQLRDYVRSEGIELVDAQESRDRKAAVLSRLLFRLPARVVITRRQESGSFRLQNLLYAAGADRVVAISHGVSRSLAGQWMPLEKIAVVHIGIDPARLAGEVSPEELAALRDELGIDPDLPTVGVVARRKDQETLLRALVQLRRRVNVLFVGIERDASLAALEAALPEGVHVAYTGFRDRVLPFYRLMDVKVLTTRSEGLSQAILESMVAGVPVVSAAVGGTPEVVVDGESGLLFPPGDDGALAESLERVLSDRPLRERLARGGRERIEGHFHVERMIDRTEALYRELLGRSG